MESKKKQAIPPGKLSLEIKTQCSFKTINECGNDEVVIRNCSNEQNKYKHFK